MTITHNPPYTPKTRRKFIEFAQSDYIFGLDVETTAIDEEAGAFGDTPPKLRLVQVANGAGDAWNLDASHPGWHGLFLRWARTKVRFVTHTDYDPLILMKEWGVDITHGNQYVDTLTMAALLWPGNRWPKDLKTLVAKHVPGGKALKEAEAALLARFRELAPVGHRVGKKLKAWGFSNIDLDDPIYERYAALDAIYVRKLLDVLAKYLREAGMAPLSRQEQVVRRSMTRVTYRGHRVDSGRLEAILADESRAFGKAVATIKEITGLPARSPNMGAWLQAAGVEFTDYTPTGQPKLDKEHLEYLEADAGSEAKAVLESLREVSDRSNLLANLNTIKSQSVVDGYSHGQIRTIAAVTGRMSIVKPAMQTFKKEDTRLRGMFLSRPGHVLVGADYDSQEIRIGACFSRDPLLLKVIQDGLNQHDLTAEAIFGKGFTSAQRHDAKITNFAQQYEVGIRTLAKQLGKSYEETREIWLSWKKAYATFAAWSKQMARYTEVVNPFGRRIPSDPYRSYANGNYMIQSTGRDALGGAIVELEDRGWGDTIWLPIHDELVLEVPEKKAAKACKVLEEAMYLRMDDQIELTASAVVVGHRWGGDLDGEKAAA